MSRCIDIFVQSDVLLEDLLGTLENLLSIKLHKMELDAEIWHEYISEHILISFGYHSFENDRDMDFENYRYDISIRSINMYDPMRSDNVRRRFAWRIYSMLRALINTTL